jgi:hypothetical protein
MIFENFSPNNKVWIYISNYSIDQLLHNNLNKKFNDFFVDWKSHGEKIKGEFKVIDNYIIALTATVINGSMCGRAVDAQVRLMKELDQEFQLDLLNRNKMAYLSEEKIKIFDFKDLKYLIKNNKINLNTFWCNTFLSFNKEDIYLPFSKSPYASLYFS